MKLDDHPLKRITEIARQKKQHTTNMVQLIQKKKQMHWAALENHAIYTVRKLTKSIHKQQKVLSAKNKN